MSSDEVVQGIYAITVSFDKRLEQAANYRINLHPRSLFYWSTCFTLKATSFGTDSRFNLDLAKKVHAQSPFLCSSCARRRHNLSRFNAALGSRSTSTMADQQYLDVSAAGAAVAAQPQQAPLQAPAQQVSPTGILLPFPTCRHTGTGTSRVNTERRLRFLFSF